MPTFHSGSVEIAFLDEGHGDPILLIHGFGSTKEVNWVQPGWVAALVADGRRVIALDNRGHGHSSKLYDPADYTIDAMADDAMALVEHLKLPRVDVMGYSMGGRITTTLALRYPARVRSAIIAGIGLNLVVAGGPGEDVALALEADSVDSVTDRRGRMFRSFADQTGSDRRALAACMRGSRQLLTLDQLAQIHVPVLIAVGTTDDIAGPAAGLAAHIKGSEVLDIPGRDHMRAVGDKVYKAGVLDFLARRP